MAEKTLEIVVPIFNEEAELEDSIKKLHSYLARNFRDSRWRITVADNASTDGSPHIGRKLSSRLSGVNYIRLKQKGRGRAVKKAWRKSHAEHLVYMDVDLSTDLSYLKSLVAALDRGYDIAIGNRLMDKSLVKKRPLKREILSRGYNILIKILFWVKITDAQCGFKAVNRRVVEYLLPHIKDNAWFFDSELLIVGEKVGLKIFQLPVHWTDNPGSTVRVLKTVYGDLWGLWRLFWTKPWKGLKINEK